MLNVFYGNINGLPVNVSDDLNILRKKYINEISDLERKRQSFWGWMLLERALKTCNVSIKQGFYFENGKWGINGNTIFFSLSHSKNIVCVAISDLPVGVDIEFINKEKLITLKKYFGANILSNNENELEFYYRLWTEKESLFKRAFNGVFSNRVIKEDEFRFYLSVCASEKLNRLEKIILG